MSSPIEMIKAFHSIKSYLSEEEQKELAQKLGLNNVDLEKRLRGKDEEIEFILTLYLLNSCKHIIGFDEGVSSLTNSNTPDLLVELNDGKRIFIEIKSTTEQKFKITRSNFNKRVKFAESFNYPLFFAIKLSGVWMLFESSYLESRNFKIDISNYMYSKFDDITGNRNFLFPKNLKIISHYSKTNPNNLGIQFNPHGNLVHYSFLFNDKSIFDVSTSSKDRLVYIFLLEALQDAMSVQKQTITSISDDITKIEEEFTAEYTMIDSRSLIQAPIKHMIHEKGYITDLNAYFRDLASNRKNLFTIDYFENIIYQLEGTGIPILEKKGNDIFKLSK